MNNKIVLERKLSNRMSKQDLISRGIISESHAGAIVTSNLTQLNRIQKGNFINNRISQRPSKEDLIRLRILNIGLDSNEAGHVREKLTAHLKTRPGPLEVFDYLVYPSNDSNNRSTGHHPLKIRGSQENLLTHIPSQDNGAYFIVNPADGSLINIHYGDPQSFNFHGDQFDSRNSNSNNLSQIEFENVNDVFLNQKINPDNQVKPNIINRKNKPSQNKKFKCYNFHEYKPQATPSGNRIIKCTDTRDSPTCPNYQDFASHYRELIEQQSLFLQYEVTNRCGGAGVPSPCGGPPNFVDSSKNSSGEYINNEFQNKRPISCLVNGNQNFQNSFNGTCQQNSLTSVSSPTKDSDRRQFDNSSHDIMSSSDILMCSPTQSTPNYINRHLPTIHLNSSPQINDLRVPNRMIRSKTGFVENGQCNGSAGFDCNSNIFASLMDDDNIISDVRSSDYMNSLYSDLSDFEQPYIGFGGILDFDDFPSISEKVALYEQLSTNVP